MRPKGLCVCIVYRLVRRSHSYQPTYIRMNLIFEYFLCPKICAVLHLRRLIVRWSVLSPSYAELNGCVVEVLHLFLDKGSQCICLVMLPYGDFNKLFMPYGSMHIKFLLSIVVCASDMYTYFFQLVGMGHVAWVCVEGIE